MTATAHALVGGAIASSIAEPAIGIGLSFLTHPILDIIPHWDFGWGWREKKKLRFFWEASFDLILGLLVSYIIFGTTISLWYFLACVFAAELWDLLEAPYWFLNWRFPPISWVYDFQSKLQGKAKLPWGILTQVITVYLIVLALSL